MLFLLQICQKVQTQQDSFDGAGNDYKIGQVYSYDCLLVVLRSGGETIASAIRRNYWLVDLKQVKGEFGLLLVSGKKKLKSSKKVA